MLRVECDVNVEDLHLARLHGRAELIEKGPLRAALLRSCPVHSPAGRWSMAGRREAAYRSSWRLWHGGGCNRRFVWTTIAYVNCGFHATARHSKLTPGA